MMAINIGTRRELFVDKHLVDTMENTELRLHHRPRCTQQRIRQPQADKRNVNNRK